MTSWLLPVGRGQSVSNVFRRELISWNCWVESVMREDEVEKSERSRIWPRRRTRNKRREREVSKADTRNEFSVLRPNGSLKKLSVIISRHTITTKLNIQFSLFLPPPFFRLAIKLNQHCRTDRRLSWSNQSVGQQVGRSAQCRGEGRSVGLGRVSSSPLWTGTIFKKNFRIKHVQFSHIWSPTGRLRSHAIICVTEDKDIDTFLHTYSDTGHV